MRQLVFTLDPAVWRRFRGLRYEFKNIAIDIAILNATMNDNTSGDSDAVNKVIEKIIHDTKPSCKFFNIEWEEGDSFCKVGREMKDEYVVFFTIRKTVGL